MISCVLGVWGISRDEVVVCGCSSEKVAIVSAIYCLLGVCPTGVVSWADTGSSALKRAEEEGCSTRPVFTRKLIAGREAEDGSY